MYYQRWFDMAAAGHQSLARARDFYRNINGSTIHTIIEQDIYRLLSTISKCILFSLSSIYPINVFSNLMFFQYLRLSALHHYT